MQLRRSRALVAAALVLTLPLLASCGFNKATDKPYTPGEQTNNRTGTVDVLSAIIVAAQPNSGTFIASLANKSTTQTETFESLGGANGNAIIASSFKPVPVPPMGFVNLATGNTATESTATGSTGAGTNLGVTITGNFGAGDVIPLTLNFESGMTVTMDVPVTYACQEYTGLDKSTDASPSASPSTSPSASSSVSPSSGASPSETTSSSPSATASPYVCGSSGGTGGRN